MRILVDTNVLLRLDRPADAHHPACVSAIEASRAAGHSLCVLIQNLYEYFVVATRPLPQNGHGMSVEGALLRLDGLESLFEVLGHHDGDYAAWKQLVRTTQTTGKPAHDARIASAMMNHGITHMLTLNAGDFARFPGITVFNPSSFSLPPS